MRFVKKPFVRVLRLVLNVSMGCEYNFYAMHCIYSSASETHSFYSVHGSFKGLFSKNFTVHQSFKPSITLPWQLSSFHHQYGYCNVWFWWKARKDKNGKKTQWANYAANAVRIIRHTKYKSSLTEVILKMCSAIVKKFKCGTNSFQENYNQTSLVLIEFLLVISKCIALCWLPTVHSKRSSSLSVYWCKCLMTLFAKLLSFLWYFFLIRWTCLKPFSCQWVVQQCPTNWV